MFTPMHQPRIGEYLAPGLPVSINGDYPKAVPAPALGDDTGGVLADWLGLSESDIDRLTESNVVAGATPKSGTVR
jgi:2-methylfumaryl-CoA isomerase